VFRYFFSERSGMAIMVGMEQKKWDEGRQSELNVVEA
jgi:hypothetical protein